MTMTRAWLLAALLLLPVAQDPDASLAAARAALDQGNATAAERLYRGMLALDPSLEAAQLGLAEALVRQGRSREATVVVARLAQSMLNSGRSDEAVTLLQRAVDADPEFAIAQALLGASLLAKQRYSDAAAALQRAIDLGERSPQTFLLLAGARWERGDLDDAARAYDEAIDAGGGAIALHQLGSLLLWQGLYQEAVEPLSAAAAAATPTPDLAYDLGRALEGAGRTQEALAAFARAVEAAPRYAQARYAYALLLARTDRRQEAQEQMRMWQQLYAAEQDQLHASKLQQARLDRGWGLLEAGKWQEAAEQFRQLPETIEVLEGLAAALAAGGDHAGAVVALERAVTMAPDRRDLQALLARERIAARSPQ